MKNNSDRNFIDTSPSASEDVIPPNATISGVSYVYAAPGVAPSPLPQSRRLIHSSLITHSSSLSINFLNYKTAYRSSAANSHASNSATQNSNTPNSLTSSSDEAKSDASNSAGPNPNSLT